MRQSFGRYRAETPDFASVFASGLRAEIGGTRALLGGTRAEIGGTPPHPHPACPNSASVFGRYEGPPFTPSPPPPPPTPLSTSPPVFPALLLLDRSFGGCRSKRSVIPRVALFGASTW